MPASSTITVGGAELELSDLSGTRITDLASGPGLWTADLARALEEAERDPDAPAAPAGGNPLTEPPEAIAESLARAGALWAAVAAAQADPDRAEIDGLLGLFERLADAGRTTEALQLARPLERLLMVTSRWTEVGRLLERVSAMAQGAGLQGALAWAKHEQGTLRLAARDVESAERKLRAAHALRRRVGDRTGSAATEANLRAARGSQSTRRRPRSVITLLALLAVCAVAGGLFAGLGDLVPEVATPVAPPPERDRSGAQPDRPSSRAAVRAPARTAAPVTAGVTGAPADGAGAATPSEDAPSEERRPMDTREDPQDTPQTGGVHRPEPVQTPTAEPDPPLVRVTLRIDTEGARVLVGDSELVCPPTCELLFDAGEEVELKAEPAIAPATPLDSFEWDGGCAGRSTGRTCSLVLNQATRITVRHQTVLHTVLDALGVSALTDSGR